MALAKKLGNVSLSIQSGDITRTRRTEELPDAGNGGLVYTFLFPRLHRVVKVACCHPACSLVIAILLLLTTVLTSVLALLLWPPTLNFSLRSFQAPNHVSAVRWDALRAAVNGNFTYEGAAGSPVARSPPEGAPPSPTKRASGVWPPCPSNGQTQRIMHAYWALSLVYVVPKGSPDQNVFSRLARIYDIEQHIYNDPGYSNFCHKCWTCTTCDPVNSVLTYFYNNKQQPNSGLVKDTRSRLSSILSQYPASVLWYTGGKLNNYSSALLRSEVRVGVPLPCYDSTSAASLQQQHALVQDFFVSFIPYLEKASSE